MITMAAVPSSLHVRRMLALIEERFAEPLSLATFGRALNRQAGYLGRLFREEIGLSMREYLARMRLERAARLIREGAKVEAVALEVGYRSKKNFYRQFRRRYGTTPALYRAGDGTSHALALPSAGR
jgi:YesN/AraC family two-component response regulator